MPDTTVQMMAAKDGEASDGSGKAELVIGGLVMFAGLGLLVYAFQSAMSDLPYTAAAWLIGFALAAIGVFLWSNGMRKQRIANEIAEQRAAAQKFQADAESVTSDAIEWALKK